MNTLIWNLKGGQAKSTTAQNLGAALAKQGKSVLLVDLDGQRTLSFGLGIDGTEPTVVDWLEGGAPVAESVVKNLDALPGSISMFQLQLEAGAVSTALSTLAAWDVALFDAPPSLSPVVAQFGQYCDRVLIPTLCEPAALKGLSEAVQLIRNERPDVPIDVLRARYRSRLVLSREATDMLIASAEDFDYRLLHATIPENIAVAEAIAAQKSVLVYAPKSPGAVAYKSLGKEVSKVWKL